MSAIRVLSAGLFTTVQDLGRPGHAALGISACGAADAVALRIGNQLVGNPAAAPALEMTLRGATLQFTAAAWIALAGAECEAGALPMWTALPLAAGEILRCQAIRHGARTYLCIAGGIAVPQVLGSAATHVRSGLGGYDGRALRAGDVLPVAPSAATLRRGHLLPTARDRLYPPGEPRVLHLTEGPQRHLFSDATFATLLAAEYEVSGRSDRMGIRLVGPALVERGKGSGELVTEGVYLGAVQIPPDGQPILLAVDHQTTGGYPKLASVIAADLFRLGQLRPGERVRFAQVSLAEADARLAEQEQLLRSPTLVVA